MSLRTLSRTAIGASLRLARMPFDVASYAIREFRGGVKASHTRAQADEVADERRAEAAERRRETTARASKSAAQRKRSVEKVAEARRERVERAADEEELQAAKAKSEALDKQADAIQTEDEAERLARAATAVKEERERD